MGTAGEEVAIECADIDRDMRNGLGTVQTDRHTRGMGDTYDVLNGIDNAQYVADMGDRDKARAVVEEVSESVDIQREVVAKGNDAQSGVLAFAEHLPRDDVGMVLEVADNDFVALVNERLTETESQHIKAIGGAFGEDYFFGRGGAEEVSDLPAGVLVVLRGDLTEMVYPAVDIGIPMGVCLMDSVQDLTGFLGGGGVVQIHQRTVVDTLAEYREVFSIHILYTDYKPKPTKQAKLGVRNIRTPDALWNI